MKGNNFLCFVFLLGLLIYSNEGIPCYGGGYQTSTGGSSFNINNINTGSTSCPAGYTSYQIGRVVDGSGSPANQFSCMKNSTDGSCDLKFGGMYQSIDGSTSCSVNHEVTGTTVCPIGFTNTTIGTGICNSVQYICTNATSTRYWIYGGQYSKVDSTCSSTIDQFNNPLTNLLSCPLGFISIKYGKARTPTGNCNATQYVCMMEEEDECADATAYCASGSSCTNIIGGSYTCTNYVPFSSDLPIVIINAGNAIINKDDNVLGNLQVIANNNSQRNFLDATSQRNFNGLVALKIEGSDNVVKISYQIETRDSLDTNKALTVSLLDLPGESDFELKGPIEDETYMRNYLTNELGRKISAWAPRTRYVEVFVVDSRNPTYNQMYSVSYYRGIYVLTERIKRDNSRIDVNKLESNDTSNDAITGGYIVTVEKPKIGDPIIQLIGGVDYSLILQYPSDPITTQLNYIVSYFDSIKSIFASTSFANLATGYPSVVEANTFIDLFLINELSYNSIGYTDKVYLYKDRKGRVEALAVSDTADGWGIVDKELNNMTSGWVYSATPDLPYWYVKMLQDPQFNCRLVRRFQELRLSFFSNAYIMGKIQNTTDLINSASANDRQRYPSWTSIPRRSLQSAVAELQAFVSRRLTWMDSNINSLIQGQTCVVPTTTVSITEIKHVDPEFIELKNTGSVSIDLTNMQLSGGIRYSFPVGSTLTPGSFKVLCQDYRLFNSYYNTQYGKDIQFQRSLGANDNVIFLDPYGSPIWTVSYDSLPPWPDTSTVSANRNHSIVPTTLNPSPYILNNPMQWTVSAQIGGSPGSNDPASQESITTALDGAASEVSISSSIKCSILLILSVLSIVILF